MGKKVTYRSWSIEQVSSEQLAGLLVRASKLVVAIDVAKVKMMAGFGREDGTVERLVRFESPGRLRSIFPVPTQTSRRLRTALWSYSESSATRT